MVRTEEQSLKKGKYRNLIVIGNGFDRWQGLPTSYEHFRQYYSTHIHAILKKLGIRAKRDQDGTLITPVELIYGDAFRPSRLQDEFFWSFEASMALLDDQQLNLYFGKTNRGIYRMQETIEQAQRILKTAFGDWVASIPIDGRDAGYRFDDDCYFVNFNYTDTLEKRFHVDEEVDYHIHGDATDPESIIFGHSTHPEQGFPELILQESVHHFGRGKSKRLMGLYMVEEALHETDKAVLDNIDDMCLFMTLDDLHIEDIENIYVLGHSFAEPDYQYFEFLAKMTRMGCDLNELSALWQVQEVIAGGFDEDSLLKWMHLNMLYAEHHRSRELGKKDVSFLECEQMEEAMFGRANVVTDGSGNAVEYAEIAEQAAEAVHKRFLVEQAERTKEILEECCILKGYKDVIPASAQCASVFKLADYIDGGHTKRTADAKWHISYFSDEDKRRIEDTMRRAGCENYTLYPSIDECIERYRVKLPPT